MILKPSILKDRGAQSPAGHFRRMDSGKAVGTCRPRLFEPVPPPRENTGDTAAETGGKIRLAFTRSFRYLYYYIPMVLRRRMP
jgi:hypothetical protein